MEEIDTRNAPLEAETAGEPSQTPDVEGEAGEQPAEYLAGEGSGENGGEQPEDRPAEDASATVVQSEAVSDANAATATVMDSEASTAEESTEEVESRPEAALEMPLPLDETAVAPPMSDAEAQAVVEAMVYIAEEPLTVAQLANALKQPADRMESILRRLIEEFERPEHGIGIREVAGGFKMATKPEHHEAVRSFVKSLKAPLKLSLPALETLAVIAYKQPVTGPEIMQIRGVQGLGVLKTLLDRKLIAAAGRKNVLGKPMLYKTTKEFLIQFGLKDINELPSLKEFEEIRRMAFGDEPAPAPAAAPPETAEEAQVDAPAGTAAESTAAEPPEAEAVVPAEPAVVTAPESAPQETEGEPSTSQGANDSGSEAKAETEV